MYPDNRLFFILTERLSSIHETSFRTLGWLDRELIHLGGSFLIFLLFFLDEMTNFSSHLGL